MRFARTYVAVILSLALVIPTLAQQAGTSAAQSSPQALTLLQQSLAALSGRQPISDVTLSGNVRRIAGSDDESGSATFKALAGTGALLDLSLPSGTRSELRNTSGPEPVAAWSGPDGVAHSIAYHNVLNDSGLFPPFMIASIASNTNRVVTLVGPETRNGQSVVHITVSQQFPALSGNIAPGLPPSSAHGIIRHRNLLNS